MLTEENRERIARERLQQRRQFLNDIIKAAARYERLLALDDFQALLKDLDNVAVSHTGEITMMEEALGICTSSFKKMRIAEIISQHVIRRSQIKEARNYPELLVNKANEAREELIKIKEQEKGENHV